MSETCLTYSKKVIHIWNEDAEINFQFSVSDFIVKIVGATIDEGLWLSILAEVKDSDLKLLKISLSDFDFPDSVNLKALIGSVNILTFMGKSESEFIFEKDIISGSPVIKVTHCEDKSLVSYHREDNKTMIFSTMTCDMVSKYLFNLVQGEVEYGRY